MLSALTFGLVLPLITAGLLFAGGFAALGAILRLARTWRPSLHERLSAVLVLNSFASTLVVLYVLFLFAVWFWYRFM